MRAGSIKAKNQDFGNPVSSPAVSMTYLLQKPGADVRIGSRLCENDEP
jgi:hypothetical protein